LTVVKYDPMGALHIHLFTHFCCRMYRLATMNSAGDKRTDIWHCHENSQSYCMQQHDWLKMQ